MIFKHKFTRRDIKDEASRLRTKVKTAFEIMDTRSRVTQGIRMVTAFISVVLVITLLAGAHKAPANIYIVRLDTSKIDVSKGLFTAMRADLSSNEDLNGSFGAGLTSSEILALTDYAEAQVENAPDYITSSLYSWCRTSHDYDIQGDYMTSNDFTFKISNTSTTCSSSVKSYFFDYRSLLSQSHFEIILEYAYGNTGNNQKYLQYLQRRVKLAHTVPNLLIFTAVSQVSLVVLLFAYYRFENDARDISKLIAHLSSSISLASFISCVVACVSMTVIYLEFKTDIHEELSSFGLNLHLGSAFFTILWFIFALVFLSMASWGGPIWCAPPSAIELDDEAGSEMAFLETDLETDIGDWTSKTTRSSTKKFKLSKFRQNTVELEGLNNEERSPSPTANFLTNEEEVMLKSNDKIFRSGTFRY